MSEDDEARIEDCTGVDDALEFVQDDLRRSDAGSHSPIFRVCEIVSVGGGHLEIEGRTVAFSVHRAPKNWGEAKGFRNVANPASEGEHLCSCEKKAQGEPVVDVAVRRSHGLKKKKVRSARTRSGREVEERTLGVTPVTALIAALDQASSAMIPSFVSVVLERKCQRVSMPDQRLDGQ